MNTLNQSLPSLKQGDAIKLVLSNGSITGTLREYRQDVNTVVVSDIFFGGVYLPFIMTISTALILELAKL